MTAAIERFRAWLLALVGAALAAGCHTDMWRQPKMVPLSENDFFPDRQGSRPLVEGTVARGKGRLDEPFHTGFENGRLITYIPVARIDEAFIRRGKERYDIFCSHCHGAAGYGDGMITQRGLAMRRAPASFHTDRLREMPIGHFFDVITNGFGTMFPQRTRIPAEDRWAIAAYVRVLQGSQNARLSDLTPEERAELEALPAQRSPEEEATR